jgi:PTH1 family peptidyl-tRNA hydrolase
LGNPGAKYKNTRHNLGFVIVDSFAMDHKLAWRYSSDFMCYFIKAKLEKNIDERPGDFVLVKPSTYMNKSGESVLAISNFYKIDGKDILVIHDDLDLEFGKVRLSFERSSAGHKGVESVIESLGGFEFGRLRVGIGSPRLRLGEAGHPQNFDPEKYVLEEFSEEEQEKLKEVITKCQRALESYIDLGLEATMNRFN